MKTVRGLRRRIEVLEICCATLRKLSDGDPRGTMDFEVRLTDVVRVDADCRASGIALDMLDLEVGLDLLRDRLVEELEIVESAAVSRAS